jgi:hypothetical protein
MSGDLMPPEPGMSSFRIQQSSKINSEDSARTRLSFDVLSGESWPFFFY